MAKKPSFKELEQRVEKLEKENATLKKTKESLRESEERYRILFETSPDVISCVSIEDETITSLNPSFEKSTGWSRAEWIGKPFLSIIHPEDIPIAAEKYLQFLRGEVLSPFELRILTKSGKEVIAEFMIEPETKGGKKVGFYGFVRDITKRKRAEQALREQALRNQRILQTAMDGFCIMNMEGDILETNEAARRIYGYSQEDLDGMNICDAKLAFDTTPKDFLTHRDKVIKEGSHCFEMRIQCKDGRIAEVELNLNFVDLGEGFFYCFLHDITDKKRDEKALKER
jgi:PAS domain S-box-containing protein